jgi:enolase-phosphatase E1
LSNGINNVTIRCVLMDIEGTIVPVTFVREVLFPYARRRMSAFLRDQRDNPSVRQWAAACQEAVARETGRYPAYETLPDILDRWIEEDRKHPGLKALQGMIWEEGYATGAFVPALYDDVVPMLTSWRAIGLQLALYSSGSERAQQLLITHTTTGDLTGLFTRFFDTRVGPKIDPASYRHIAELLECPPEAIAFLSDVEAELDAAAVAGMKTRQIVRPGTQAGSRHPVAFDFLDVTLCSVAESTPTSLTS